MKISLYVVSILAIILLTVMTYPVTAKFFGGGYGYHYPYYRYGYGYPYYGYGYGYPYYGGYGLGGYGMGYGGLGYGGLGYGGLYG